MAYTPKEHITILEELMVLRETYPFCLFTKSKLGKWVAGDAENFYAYNMQVYTSKTDGARKKK